MPCTALVEVLDQPPRSRYPSPSTGSGWAGIDDGKDGETMSGTAPFFHAHVHSEYSVLDGMPKVADIVAKAAKYKQPGIALTDHGNMSGAIELYQSAKEHGIKPFPGQEFYVVQDHQDKDARRYHLTVLALNYEGYKALAWLSSKAHERDHYHYRPRIDLADLAELSGWDKHNRGIALLTGCFSGHMTQMLIHPTTRTDQYLGAKTILRTFQNWFPDRVFMEFMHHGATFDDGVTDDDIVAKLWDMSGHGFMAPPIITQDSHYLHSSDKELHDLMKRMAYHGSDNAEFKGGHYHLASRTYMREVFSETDHGRAIWEAAQASYERLLDMWDLSIPAADEYQYHVPHGGKEKWLRDRCNDALGRMNNEHKWSARTLGDYAGRMDTELRVIEDLGMAGYFYMIWRGVKFARDEGIYVGARGSANGSLVCFLLGITQVDPMKWNLLFERFLSNDRKKPPDVDLDIEDGRREDIVKFYQETYDEVVQLGTYQSLGVNQFTGGGSVLVSYIGYKRRSMDPQRFKREYAHIKRMEDLPDDERIQLEALAQYRVRKSAGAHAAGFAVGTRKQPLAGLVPTMLIPSSNTTVTQYTMDTVEGLGFVKIDLLGQRTLTTIKRCLENLGRDPADGLEWIPNDDRATLRDLRRGQSETGVFQFEGWAAAKGCRELGVKSTKDCINVMALYRPATMRSGYTDLFLKNRSEPSRVQYVHPVFAKHLRETHGVAIYQEQIMSILRDLGVPFEELNEFLSALKMSNDKEVKAQRIFKRQRKVFIKYAQNAGMTTKEAKIAWDEISGFAGYGFNRAHATAYGLLGYRAAYLHTHFPLEYMAAVLETTAGTPKEKVYLKEARRLGLKLRPADVNRSGIVHTIERDSIRKGLTSVKGIGVRAAEDIVENAPYDDVSDLIERTTSRIVTGGKEWDRDKTLRGVMLKLKEGNALRSLGIDKYV